MKTSKLFTHVLIMCAILGSNIAQAGGDAVGYNGPDTQGKSIPVQSDREISLENIFEASKVCYLKLLEKLYFNAFNEKAQVSKQNFETKNLVIDMLNSLKDSNPKEYFINKPIEITPLINPTYFDVQHIPNIYTVTGTKGSLSLAIHVSSLTNLASYILVIQTNQKNIILTLDKPREAMIADFFRFESLNLGTQEVLPRFVFNLTFAGGEIENPVYTASDLIIDGPKKKYSTFYFLNGIETNLRVNNSAVHACLSFELQNMD